MCLENVSSGELCKKRFLPTKDASRPASTETDWGKEGAVSGLWDQCAGLGQAFGNIRLPWTQEYMQLSRLDIISSLLSEELIVYSMS